MPNPYTFHPHPASRRASSNVSSSNGMFIPLEENGVNQGSRTQPPPVSKQAQADVLAAEEEGDDDIGDITELPRPGQPYRHNNHYAFHSNAKRGGSASTSTYSLQGLQGAAGSIRRRLSRAGGGPGLGASAANLLESVLMKSSSRQPSFQTSSSSPYPFFPHPSHAPSFARLPIPWSSTGAPRDSREADMLSGLALALSSYGAPLYRVEHRVSQAAAELSLPVSIFCLPSTLMVAIGDGSIRHPCRVQYLSYSYAVHIGKLQDVDRLSRRVCEILHQAGASGARRMSAVSEAADGMGTARASGVFKSAAVSPMTQNSSRTPIPEVTGSNRSSTVDMIGAPSVASTVAFGAEKTAIRDDADLDTCLSDLQNILRSPNDYRRGIRILAGALQSGVIVVLLFKGSWADGLAATFLGGLCSILLFVSDLCGLEGAIELLAAMVVAACARFMESFEFWNYLSSGKGLCHEVVSLGAVCQLMPGTAITLGMLELGSTNPVAGSVRMFQAFVRALKLGYGLSTGSRIAIGLFQLLDMWEDPGTGACPPAGRTAIDFWRLPLWIPMNLAIMVNLKAYPWQWPYMTMTSLIGYCVSLLASQWFNSDITAGMAAFSMAIAANIHARRSNEIAIGGVLSGIVWLVPGGIGVRGAMAALAKDVTTGGTAFGIDMMVRAMSIAVGLYMANVLAFPIMTDAHARDAFRDDMLTV
ncbi:hypothetical protein DFS34DRAFT_605417 [Phlyctochytrium arcticum]|nr:hypothetical protein DFS34DRAFT_605417 [Phlyctochytrium arcticum]